MCAHRATEHQNTWGKDRQSRREQQTDAQFWSETTLVQWDRPLKPDKTAQKEDTLQATSQQNLIKQTQHFHI